ncbi:MAG: type II secretion system F family protein [Candidatus Micrarchaeota archaeon]|nr:type II secretion system F family protein [Candidatus Micrarchaeota archaeon]
MLGLPKKKKTVEVDGQKIELQPKPGIGSGLSGMFGQKPKTPQAPQPAPTTTPVQTTPAAPPPPIKPPVPEASPKKVEPNKPYSFQFPGTKAAPKPQATPQPGQPNKPYTFQFPGTKPSGQKPGQPTPSPTSIFNRMAPPSTQKASRPQGPPSRIRLYIEGIGAKHPDLEGGLRKEGIKESVYEFIKRMLILSVIFTIAIAGVTFVVLYKLLHNNAVAGGLLAVMVGLAVFMTVFRSFLNFPTAKGKSSSKKVERDILFAARDLIIALRSGMPLFNAITSVSSGYGEASKEFLKIVEKVQLGTPLEDAIDEIVSSTKSASFRKIMLQASVSIRVGADVTSALQSVIDQLQQERVIELRRYGQRLNAIAMFYMLFGIILPSMGIAVLTILTTFIPIFSVNATILEVVVVGLAFMQVVFLQMIRGSRPIFTM